MRRRAAKVDANHADIVAALRRIGCRVQSLAPLGNGVPDLLCARAGRLRLLEVKDGSLPPSRRRLTDDEAAFYDAWHPHVVVVGSVDEALAAMGAA